MDYAASSSLASLGDAPVEALPFGVDNQHFFPAASSEPREPTVPTILFVGTLDRAHRFKGVDILLSALKRLSNLSWSLSIVGDGGDRLALERTAAELGLERRVAFAGDVSDRELPDRYRTAALHVLPSTERAEAFGLVTLEAAASGIPSIVSDLPGVRTTVVHGETGLIVPPGDPAALALALRELLQSPARRLELGRNARRRAERYYAWDPHIDRLEAIYASVVGAKPAGTL
jgi:glycosyltransferase involved in cell wall biosynthesis